MTKIGLRIRGFIQRRHWRLWRLLYALRHPFHSMKMELYYRRVYGGRNRVVVENIPQAVGGDGKGGLIFKS